MSHGFDLNSALVCEGIIGDGCGGGRIFFIEDEALFAYDPLSKTKIELLGDIKKAISLTKKACIVSIQLGEGCIELDLSTLS